MRETSTCDRAARCSGTAHGLTCREIGQNTKQHKGDHIRSVVRVVHVLSGDRLLYNSRTRGKECSEHPEHLVKRPGVASTGLLLYPSDVNPTGPFNRRIAPSEEWVGETAR